jgi:phenylpyruvate tautomerase PptA (4-oxalocrotonate tautomerase family)
MTKLPRTIRLDPSDTFVFEQAAEPGEWAVSGAFMFMDADPDALSHKQRTAFRAGLLGVESFGWSTLCTVTEASDEERAQLVETLAQRLMQHLGAPTLDVARAAAEEEVSFAQSLCYHAVGTILAVQRDMEEGEIRERFRTLHQREKDPHADPLHQYARAFTLVEDDGEEIEEKVDLMGLMKSDRT